MKGSELWASRVLCAYSSVWHIFPLGRLSLGFRSETSTTYASLSLRQQHFSLIFFKKKTEMVCLRKHPRWSVNSRSIVWLKKLTLISSLDTKQCLSLNWTTLPCFFPYSISVGGPARYSHRQKLKVGRGGGHPSPTHPLKPTVEMKTVCSSLPHEDRSLNISDRHTKPQEFRSSVSPTACQEGKKSHFVESLSP